MSQRSPSDSKRRGGNAGRWPKSRRQRTDQARALRRNEILEAASITFAKLGYADAEMETIADRIGVAKGTLYLYFGSKRELFLSCVDEGVQRLTEAVRQSTEGIEDPLQRISTAVLAYLHFFDENPHVVELFIQERATFKDRKKPAYFVNRDFNQARWREVYVGLIAAGRIRADMTPEQLMDSAGNLLYGTVIANRLSGKHPKAADQASQVVEFLFHGLRVSA